MSRLSREFSWKLIVVICGLSLLSLVAPSLWRGLRSGPVLLAKRLEESSAPLPATSIVLEALPAAAVVSPAGALVGSEPALALHDLPAPNVGPPARIADALSELAAYSAPAEIAPSGPLVAEQIDLDPSLTLLPAFPVREPRSNELPMPGPISEPVRTVSTSEPAVDPQVPIEAMPPIPSVSIVVQEPATTLPPPMPFEPAIEPKSPLDVGPWPVPVALLKQLKVLQSSTGAVVNWCQRVTDELAQLARSTALGDARAEASLQALESLVAETKEISKTFASEEDRSDLLRAGYALTRRLVIWKQVHELANRTPPQVAVVDVIQIQECLVQIDERLNEIHDNGQWRKYLMFERVQGELDSAACAPADQRELCRTLLRRMHSNQLSHEQQ